MDFWKLMIKKDDIILNFINFIFKIKSLLNFKNQRLLSKMSKQPKLGNNRDIFIILNGPSLKKQDLYKLKGECIMFVNRGFKHPLFAELKPEFYTIIDPKMITGEWSVTWLDEIHQMAPSITFIMPVAWSSNPIFKPYIDKGYSFYWIKNQEPCTCLGVSGACFNFGISQNFKTIYFTGFDANGLPYEMSNSSSHFYGVNEENLQKNTNNYVTDLFMFSRHFRDLNKFAENCKRRDIKMINLTEGGLLDMFPRLNINNINK